RKIYEQFRPTSPGREISRIEFEKNFVQENGASLDESHRLKAFPTNYDDFAFSMPAAVIGEVNL
ncbi:MAG TPA: hypothetical protein V6C72_06760, partial [Chroococcales cyanobacterium]